MSCLTTISTLAYTISPHSIDFTVHVISCSESSLVSFNTLFLRRTIELSLAGDGTELCVTSVSRCDHDNFFGFQFPH